MALTSPGLMAVGRLLLLGALLLLAEGCFAPPPPVYAPRTLLPQERIAVQINEAVAAALTAHPQSREAHLLQKFYAASYGRPAWIDQQGISHAAWQLVAALEGAGRDGLPPRRYAPEELRALLRAAADEDEPYLGWPAAQVVELEIALSRAFFRYAGDHLWGQERSWRSRGDWHRARRDIDPVALLALALELDAMPSALEGLPTSSRDYLRLRQALHRYRALAALGGWPEIEQGPTLHPGESDPRVPHLRRRLWLEGDLTGALSQDPGYDFELQQGVATFQRRHGLRPDGTLGPQTLSALNVPIEQRIDQLLRNMERWRWERGEESTEIRINLAAFALEVRDGGSPLFEMPVVVGRQERSTPLFASQLEALVLAPYWYVPPTLLREALPRIVADPAYLQRNHYEVLDAAGEPLSVGRDFGARWQRGEVAASLRQQPGSWNPMGKIKFLLPNPWSIYLHDTPQKQLFGRTQRAFSSGCIRLSDPQRLARWLLTRDSWNPARIDELFEAGSSRLIPLEEAVPLRIGYWTAWVADNGRVNFRDDIYGRDQRLARELRQNPPRLAVAAP